MAVFYFDAENHERLTEDDRFELADLDVAKDEAFGYLVENAKAHLTRHHGDHIFCTVKDENKNPLVQLRIVFEITDLTK